MPLVRTHDAASTSDSNSNKERPHKRRRVQQTLSAEPTTPGVSKLKASLRQTRRLLAKDTLAADVRVDTERRLHALEAELAAAEQANRERAMATKYHRIKFFDRKKLLRRVKQVQRQLGVDELSSKERKKLERTLGDLRVDLNYVTHYPKAERYISLFPPEIRQHENDGEVTHSTEPICLRKGEEPATTTDKRREELRTWVRERMVAGEFANEPEVSGGAGQERNRASKALIPLIDGQADAVMDDEGDEQSDPAPVRSVKVERRARNTTQKERAVDGMGRSGEHVTKAQQGQEEVTPSARRRKDKSDKSNASGKSKDDSTKIGLAGDDFFGDD